MKDTMYKNNMHTTKQLKHEISVIVINISGEILAAIVINFRRWQQMTIGSDGTLN
jgi:hypothetical protein